MSQSQKRALSPAANARLPKKCRCEASSPPPASSTQPISTSSTPPTSTPPIFSTSDASSTSTSSVDTLPANASFPSIPESITTLASSTTVHGSRFIVVGVIQQKPVVTPYRGGGFFMEFLLADTTGTALVEVAKTDRSLLPKDAEIGDVLCVGACKRHKNGDRLISYADRSTYRYWSIRLQRWMHFGFSNPRAFRAMKNKDGQLDCNPYTRFTPEVSGYARSLPVMMETLQQCTAHRRYSIAWEGDPSGWREVQGELSVLNTDPPQMTYCLNCQVFTHCGSECSCHPHSKPVSVWSGIFQLHGDETTEIHMCGAFADVSTGQGATAEESLAAWMEEVVEVTSCTCGSCKVTTSLQVMDVSAKIQGPKGVNQEGRCIVRPFHLVR